MVLVVDMTYMYTSCAPNIDIDDALIAEAMKAGPFKTKTDAVEAGLTLLARQAAYREILKWRGKLRLAGRRIDRLDQRGDSRWLAAEPTPRSPVAKGGRRAGR